MESLTVSRAGKESFLAQVISFGSEHEILTAPRRQALVQETVALHQSLVALFRRNPVDVGEALAVAELLDRLIAVGLERESGGDLFKAATQLRDKSLRALTDPLVSGIAAGIARVAQVLGRSVFTGHTKFEYDVEVWRVRMCGTNDDGVTGRTHIMPAVNALTVVEWLDSHKTPVLCMHVCERIATLSDYTAWEREVAKLEREERISTAYLPWAQLEEDAGIRRSRLREFSEAVVGVWTPKTLIATLTASLVCGGTMRLFPDAVFAADLFKHFRRVIKYPANFKERGRVKFARYLDEHLKVQDVDAKTHLMMLWEEAMQEFLAPLPRRSLSALPVSTWSERMHLGLSVRALARSYLGKDARVAGVEPPKKKTIVEKIRALGDEPKRASIAGILRRLKETDLKGEGTVEELLALVPPDSLIRCWPITVDAVTELTNHWRLPRSRFTDADRKAFVAHLLKEAPSEFWRDMTDELYDRLSAVDPEQEQALWFERERWASKKKK